MALATKRWVNGRLEEVAGPVRPRRLDPPVQRETIPFSVRFYREEDGAHKATVSSGSVYVNFLTFHKDGSSNQKVVSRVAFAPETTVDPSGGWNYIKVKIEIGDLSVWPSIVVHPDISPVGGAISNAVAGSLYVGAIYINLAYCYIPTVPPSLSDITFRGVYHVGSIFIPFPYGFVLT